MEPANFAAQTRELEHRLRGLALAATLQYLTFGAAIARLAIQAEIDQHGNWDRISYYAGAMLLQWARDGLEGGEL